MFPCVGRRVSLVKSFKKAASSCGLDCMVIGTDKDPTSAALQCCDFQYLMPPIERKDYFQKNLEVIERHGVNLLIPTLDTDLPIWSRQRSALKKIGCFAAVSSTRVIETCQDKRLTHDFLKKNGFNTPDVYDLDALIRSNGNHFPYFLKPWNGSAARGSQIVRNMEELKFFSSRIPNCMVQSYVQGEEYTIDAFIDFDGEIRCIVPRKRIEVRGGEVVKAQTVKNKLIMNQTKKMLSLLKAGPGVITTQCFLDVEGKVKFIEINPRFGGGVPLSIKAGANFPKWLIELRQGKNPKIGFDKWRDNLMMIRYDSEVWKNGVK